MKLETEFVELPLSQLHYEAAVMKAGGWRFIQTHAVNGEAGIDLYYSFMKDGLARNYKIVGVTKDMPVPSITDLFLAAFVFENEARELFGVDMRDIALDFQGALYAPAESEPMTFITPEQKAAREKAARAAEAKAAKESGEGGESAAAAPALAGIRNPLFIMTPERRARLDAKLATMSPEKVAKVEAAVKARAAEVAQAESAGAAKDGAVPAQSAESETKPKPKTEQKPAEVPSAAQPGDAPAIDRVLEDKLAHMDPDKAAKVRAVLAKKAGAEPVADAGEGAPAADLRLDPALESKIAIMDPEKAAKVREALLRKAARDASGKGGE